MTSRHAGGLPHRLPEPRLTPFRARPRLSKYMCFANLASATLFLGWSLLLLAGCAPRALGPLVVDGQELHASLVTRKLEDAAKLHLAPVLRDNPYLSTDAEFVDILAKIASQGRLGG